MSLGDSHDTVGTYLALAYCGDHADDTNSDSDSEEQRTICCKVELEDEKSHEEGNESVITLGGRKG